MCGRYSLDYDLKNIIIRYKATKSIKEFQARDEIFPTDLAPVVVRDQENMIAIMKWGFAPGFAKQPLINARGETIDIKPTFKNSFYNKRCIIPVSSFFEWENIDGKKIRRRISISNEKIFSLAGLYDVFQDKEGKEYAAYTIITTEANKEIKVIHHRMPVIIPKDMENIWLDRNNRNIKELKDLLRPYKKDMVIL
ncbi:MAG TPA: SOS response-associated peptidase [Tissierellaceae bacterium]|nr:SOS response-associated peptidase [Tissierellaceae bacterium]